MTHARGAFLAALLALAGAAISVHADGVVAGPTPGMLQLRSGTYAVAMLPDLLAGGGAFKAGGSYVLAFDGPMTAERRAALDQAGVGLREYLPTDCFIASLDGVKAGSLRQVPGLRSVHAFDPAWKVAAGLGQQVTQDAELEAIRGAGKWPVMISLFSGADPDAALTAIRGIAGVEVVSVSDEGGSWMMTGSIPPAAAAAIAALDAVHFIDDAPAFTFRNGSAAGIIQSNIAAQTPLWNNGLTGTGQIIAMIDGMPEITHCSFLDPVNPVGPLHRKIQAMNGGVSPSFHGTHVAGTLIGNAGVSGDTRGIAHNARMVYNTQPSFSETSMFNRLDLHRTQGAFVHSNSWGNDNTTAYDGIARAIDNFSWQNDDNLVLFAVTNGSLLKNPENAKNCLAVAASGDAGSQGNFCSGGRGPTTDGRRKPEVMAPGCSIRSADYSSSCGVTSATGTSMACPMVAGLATLMRQYFVDGYYPTGAANPADSFAPAAPLIKAALINSSTDMTGISGYPSNQEGWGRVLGDDVLMFPADARKLVVAQTRNAGPGSLMTGGSYVLRLRVTDETQTLKVTLAYHDAPAAVSASLTPVNNLDLEVTPLGGASYLGNVFTNGRSTSGGTADALNNVEQVIVQSPPAGSWMVRVSAPAVNVGTQGFGLVVSGGVETLCLADFNGDGFVDFFDYDAFVEGYEAGSAFNDINGDGFLDFFDYDAFVEVYEAGC
ncbi:MAG: S8 family serine peptidase [Tepidisphaera sp.]